MSIPRISREKEFLYNSTGSVKTFIFLFFNKILVIFNEILMIFNKIL